MIPPPENPLDLLFDQLRDLHSVDSQVAETLPLLGSLAGLTELRILFRDQRARRIARAGTITAFFRKHDRELGPDVSLGMKGLIEGGNRHLERVEDPRVRDLMLVAHGVRIQHYGIAAWGFVTALGHDLGLIGLEAWIPKALWEDQEALRVLERSGEYLSAARPGKT